MGMYDDSQVNNELLGLQRQQGAPGFMQETSSNEPQQPLSGQEQALLQTRTAEQNNWLVSLVHNGFGDWTKSDPNFNPWNDIKDTEYAKYPDYFVNVDNAQELADAKQQVDEKRQYEDLYSRAPTTGFWSAMAWGMADPLLAIPGVGSVKLAREGAIATKTAAMAGAATLAAAGIGETAMQATHPDRTAAESALNIAAAGVVGAAFGGLVGKIVTPEIKLVEDANRIDSALGKSETFSATPKASAEINPTYDAQQQAQDAIKQVLSIPDESMPVNDSAVAATLDNSNKPSISDLVNEHNMEGHVNPINRYWQSEHPPEQMSSVAQDRAAFNSRTSEDIATEEDLAKALEPQGAILGEENSQSMGAGYVTYDARVAGLPNWALKASAIPHVMPVSLEGLASPSPIIRDLTTRIFNMHLPMESSTLEGGLKAAPISVESKMAQDMKQGLDFNEMLNSQYMRHLQLDPNSFGANAQAILRSKGKSVLGSDEFGTQVMDAMNNGDYHPIKEVQDMAHYSRGIVKDVAKRLREAGYDLVDDPNYFKRAYNIPAILDSGTNFEDALAKDFLTKQHAEIIYEKAGKEYTDTGIYNSKTKTVDWMPKEGETLKSVTVKGGLSVDDARSAARDAVNTILKLGDKSLALGDLDRLDFARGADSLRPRTLDTAYEILRPWLVQDFKGLMHAYLAGASRAIRHKELLSDLGLDNLNDLRIRNRDWFDSQISHINNVKVAKADDIKRLPKEEQKGYVTKEQKAAMIKKLRQQSQSSQKLLNDILQLSLGQFKKRSAGDPFWRITNQYNAIRLLGGVTISSLGDPMAAFIKNSVSDVVWHGWIGELKRSFLPADVKALKKQDYRDALTAIQGEMDDAVRFLMNPTAENYMTGNVEKAFQAAGQLNQKLTLMQYWNNFWQRVNHNVAEARILRNLNRGWENITNKEKQYLAEAGIDKSMSERIWAQQKEFGQEIQGTHISNSRMWRDEEAKLRFNNALRLEVRKSPIMTEMGDMPRFFAKTEFRRSMFQFKGFPAASSTKLLLSMAARHDMRAALGLVGLTSAGMATYILKEKIAGREPDMSMSNLISQGIDKSGILGLIADPMFQGKYALQSIKKFGGQSWFTEPTDYVFGPNASVINPVYSAIMEKLAGKSVDKKTEYQLKALIPYHNLFYLQGLVPKKGNSGASR